MRAKQVVGGPERIVRTHDIRECFVQKVYPDAEIRNCGGAAPSSHAGRNPTAPHRRERFCRLTWILFWVTTNWNPGDLTSRASRASGRCDESGKGAIYAWFRTSYRMQLRNGGRRRTEATKILGRRAPAPFVSLS